MTSGLPGLRSANAPDAKAIDTSESRNIIPECSPSEHPVPPTLSSFKWHSSPQPYSRSQ